jgi:hypothetical protein
MKKFILFLSLSAIVLAGCARVFHVKVDSINGGADVTGAVYAIFPGNQNTDPNDLQFREYASYLSRALKILGYAEAAPGASPDIEIYLSYGMGDAVQHVSTYNVPVYGQTGVQSYTYVNTTRNASGISTISNTYETPQYGITGFTTQTDTYTTYPKYIIIDAYDARNVTQGSQMKQIFKTSISSQGASRELRKVFPYMLAGAEKYIGANTGEEITVSFTADNPMVLQIKGIAKQ